MAVPVADDTAPKPNYASLAANLANSQRKTIAPEPPKYDKLIPHFHGHGRSKSTNTPPAQPINYNVSLASSKAALQAHNSRRPRSQDGPNSARPPQTKQTLESRAAKQALVGGAAAAASTKSWHMSSQRPASHDGPSSTQHEQNLGDRAAAAATKSWNNQSAAPTTSASTRSVYGERGERASPAVSKAWGAQKASSYRPVVAPLSTREAAMIQAKINARQQESTERHERKPIIRIGAEFLGEHPPVRLEREEKAHAADLHEQAVALAKQAYAKQQSNQTSHRALGSQAQQLASDKLAKLNKTDNDLDTMRSYYGTPAPPARSKSQMLLRRSKSQASKPGDAEDIAQAQKIRSQMNLLRAQVDQVDANQQEQDRKRLIEAARKKVQVDMLKMDENVFKDTGKMTKAMMDDWDTKTREKQKLTKLQAPAQRIEHDKAVNIGGGKLVDQNEIDQLAISRVKPTLAGIDEAVQKKRDLDEQRIEEKEERKREKEKEKEEKAEVKRVKAEEKKRIKDQKAAEKAEATDGEEKHSGFAAKLPTLPKFGRHKRTESTQTDQTDEDALATVEDPETSEQKKSAIRLPAFAKFSRHRRTESTDHESDDDTRSVEETSEKKRLSLFNKLSRRSQPAAEEHTDVVVPSTEAEEHAPATTEPANAKSLKSRITKLVHRAQYTDAVEHQASEPTFEARSRARSVSTELEDDDDSLFDGDERREETAVVAESSKLSAPAFVTAPVDSTEGRLSIEDRDDKLFGKHLPSKFVEDM